jgi:hypothetical protein
MATSRRFVSRNTETPICTTRDGIQIDLTNTQFRNAESSIRDKFEFLSNVTTESVAQTVKHPFGIIFTEAGRQTDSSDEQLANAYSPIRRSRHTGQTIERRDEQSANAKPPIADNCERFSNATAERLLQRPKQPSPRVVTEEGMRIEGRDAQPRNAPDSMTANFAELSNITAERSVDSTRIKTIAANRGHG